jgi:osmotically-inducible protein OsmY
MGKNILFAVSLAAMLLGTSPASANDIDNKLQDQIEARLKANKLGHVDVDVENGVAKLSGEVATTREKTRAEQLAKVKGVATIDSKLEIDPDKAKARIEERADATKERIEKTAEARSEAVEKNAEAAKENVEKKAGTGKEAVERKAEAGKETVEGKSETVAAEVNDPNKKVDPLITANVKMKFAVDDLVKAHQINVDSERDGVVTLRGVVDSEAAHKRAVEIAKGTNGVRQVNDLLKVEPTAK